DVLAGLGVRVGYFDPAHAGIFQDTFVHELLDIGYLLWRERRAVEVEGELIGTYKRSLLRGVAVDDLVQGPVQQVGDGMMAFDGVASTLVHREGHGCAHGRKVGGIYDWRLTICEFFGSSGAANEVKPSVARLLRVDDAPDLAAGAQGARVA